MQIKGFTCKGQENQALWETCKVKFQYGWSEGGNTWCTKLSSLKWIQIKEVAWSKGMTLILGSFAFSFIILIFKKRLTHLSLFVMIYNLGHDLLSIVKNVLLFLHNLISYSCVGGDPKEGNYICFNYKRQTSN
jgi:hypothetical protein